MAFSSTKYIEYTHTSSGGRIEKYVRDDAAGIDENWYYIKGFVFKGDNLDHFGMSEGVVRNVDGQLRYEYFLKDHQGNTRMSFTADGQDDYLATMEDSQASTEEILFLNVDETRHNDGQFILQTGALNSRLSYMNGLDESIGGSGEIGLAKSLKVGKGDIISMSVLSRYVDTNCGGNCQSVGTASVTTALASMFGGVANAGGEVQAIYDGIENGVTNIFAGGGHGSGSSGSKVYLNWLLFDENYTIQNQGHDEASTTASLLSLTIPSVSGNGYLYVYLSNESGGTQKAYFDNSSINHTKKIDVLQENVYYPFGLTFEGVAVHVPTSTNSTINKYLYNQGSEQVEFDVRNYDTPFRQYDATIGRFQGVDLLADLYSNQSPYQFANNDPIYWSDPTGLGGECKTCLFTDIGYDVKDSGQRGSSSVYGSASTCSGYHWSNEVDSFNAEHDLLTAGRLLKWSTHGGSWNSNGGVTYQSGSAEYMLDGRWENYYGVEGTEGTIVIDGVKVKILASVILRSIWVPNNRTQISELNRNFTAPNKDDGILNEFLQGLDGIGQEAGIIPYTDGESLGLPDTFKNTKSLKSVELTDTSMPVLNDGVPKTTSIIDVITNAIKLRLWAEKSGKKASDLFTPKSVEQDTVFGLDGDLWTIPSQDSTIRKSWNLKWKIGDNPHTKGRKLN